MAKNLLSKNIHLCNFLTINYYAQYYAPNKDLDYIVSMIGIIMMQVAVGVLQLCDHHVCSQFVNEYSMNVLSVISLRFQSSRKILQMVCTS